MQCISWGVFVSGGPQTPGADLADWPGGNPWMWPGRSVGPGLFQGAAWREHGDVGRDGDSNVRYLQSAFGSTSFDLVG